MPDVFTTAKRSQVMSRIRGRGNKDTEVALAKLLRANRIAGWRRHAAMPGKPDFTFRHERVVIFVDGCFWHGCPKHSNMPANNREFWSKKLGGNRERDRIVTRTLRKAGWTVIRVWEHELSKKRVARVVTRIRNALARSVPS
jgi:DNA mismatch endonuclease (patch repair protein)